MKYLKYLPTLLAALASKALSFRLGAYVVSASDNGKPVHFTFSSAFVALEQVLAGRIGSIQVGSILVTVSKNS